MSNYDAWLEKPFQDACEAADRFVAAAEQYIETDDYSEGIAQWYLDRTGEGTDIFEVDHSLITPEMHEEYQASAQFERAVESYMDPDDDYSY